MNLSSPSSLDSKIMTKNVNYPTEWKNYCKYSRQNNESKIDRNWSIYAARFRVARAFSGVQFNSTISTKTHRSYEEAIKLALSYSALEAVCAASSQKIVNLRILDTGAPYDGARESCRKAFAMYNSQDLPLASSLNPKLQDKISSFLKKTSEDLLPLASYQRHLFLHGIWTPHGGRVLNDKTLSAIKSLSDVLLRKSELLLRIEIESQWPEARIHRIAKALKADFDDDCDSVFDRPIKRSRNKELVITRTGTNGDIDYRIQLDRFNRETDEYVLLYEDSSDLDSFEYILHLFSEEGGSID